MLFCDPFQNNHDDDDDDDDEGKNHHHHSDALMVVSEVDRDGQETVQSGLTSVWSHNPVSEFFRHQTAKRDARKQQEIAAARHKASQRLHPRPKTPEEMRRLQELEVSRQQRLQQQEQDEADLATASGTTSADSVASLKDSEASFSQSTTSFFFWSNRRLRHHSDRTRLWVVTGLLSLLFVLLHPQLMQVVFSRLLRQWQTTPSPAWWTAGTEQLSAWWAAVETPAWWSTANAWWSAAVSNGTHWVVVWDVSALPRAVHALGFLLYLAVCGAVHLLLCDVALVYAFDALHLQMGHELRQHYTSVVRTNLLYAGAALYSISLLHGWSPLLLQGLNAVWTVVSAYGSAGWQRMARAGHWMAGQTQAAVAAGTAAVAASSTALSMRMAAAWDQVESRMPEVLLQALATLIDWTEVAAMWVVTTLGGDDDANSTSSTVTPGADEDMVELTTTTATTSLAADDNATSAVAAADNSDLKSWQDQAFETARLFYAYTAVFLVVLLLLFHLSAHWERSRVVRRPSQQQPASSSTTPSQQQQQQQPEQPDLTTTTTTA